MSAVEKMFVPSGPLPAARTGVLTGFAPGTRTLPTGFRVAPQFRALPVDIVLEKDVAVRLRDGTTIYVDVFRPAASERVPVIVAWSPYGKGQGTSLSVMGVFGLVGLSNRTVSGLEAHLWVEARGAEDMDLFVLVQKLDAHGTPLQAFTVPNQSAMAHDLTDHGAAVLRYKGSDGRLRVSARHLDPVLSTDDVPEHSFDRVEKLSPGQVVDIQIDLLPIGLAFHPGEQLRFVVSARNLLGSLMPGIREYAGANSGQHVVHTGGATPSYLQLPVQQP